MHAEDRAKEDLAASLAHRLRGEALLRAAEQRLTDALSTGAQPANLTGAALVARQAWTERLERSRAEAFGQLSQADADVAARRVAVTDAGRAREALDRLRARQHADFRLEASRREGIELDEIALNSYVRGTAA